MKVLFAVNNESVSESIIKKYQQEYKEIISSKNVYYFDAITRELQKDKSYDRIVISEDVEPFANNNYGVIDKFIFERLDSISDEATSNNGQDIPIILICADRRTKSENILVKLFGIGIYSALLGEDRTISKVCELINKPRSKKDAKIYYRIDAEDVEYKMENEGDVNEVEIQNILNHYKRLGKNEEEYVKSFDNIAEQYTDAQLRVICKFLPIGVKAVLEENSERYQQLITFGTVTPSISQEKSKQNTKYVPKQEKRKSDIRKSVAGAKLDIIQRNIGKSELTKPVIIPSTGKVDKMNSENNSNLDYEQKNEKKPEQNNIDPAEIEDILQSVEKDIVDNDKIEETPKKKRGRPKKIHAEEQVVEQPKRKRGRPKKNQEIEEKQEAEETVDLFNLVEDNKGDGELILPGLENNKYDTEKEEKVYDSGLNNIDNKTEYRNSTEFSNDYSDFTTETEKYKSNNLEIDSVNKYSNYDDSDLSRLLSMSNKLIAFVGTSKNGTSFLVNSMAEILSKKGIKTAILDLTQNKNSYYIYTKNDEQLRKKAFSCIENLKNGITDGIEVNKNLTVYTTLPDRNSDFYDFKSILTTLTREYSLVIMDCDYETSYAYFKFAQELYLVQSFDILTIQPLTAFLRNLKSKNILEPSKLRIVLNKVLRVRSITEKIIIGGMSSYNDPSMSYMTELFDKDKVQYCSIPFDQETYSRYLDGLVNCEISTKGYPKNIIASLEKLGNMIYPLLNNDRPANKFNSFNNNTTNFSNNMNQTLNKMKNRY